MKKVLVRLSVAVVSVFVGTFSSVTAPAWTLAEPFPCAQPSSIENRLEVPWIEIVREENVLKFWCGTRMVRQFPVALGKPGFETPLGAHYVLRQIPEPTFVNPFTRARIPPGPQNPLGVRSIQFYRFSNIEANAAIHGTYLGGEALIGTDVSHGCVRMFNEDVVVVYDWVLFWRRKYREPFLVWVRRTPYKPIQLEEG